MLWIAAFIIAVVLMAGGSQVLMSEVRGALNTHFVKSQGIASEEDEGGSVATFIVGVVLAYAGCALAGYTPYAREYFRYSLTWVPGLAALFFGSLMLLGILWGLKSGRAAPEHLWYPAILLVMSAALIAAGTLTST